MIRLGLVCIFREEPIKFRRTTAKYLKQLSRSKQLDKLSEILLHNADSLLKALNFCSKNGIGSFRVNSQLFPLKTHPEVGYDVKDLPSSQKIIDKLKTCGEFADQKNIRTLFHPDQFVIISSPHRRVVENSLQEIEYQNEIAELINADVINIHAGGKYDGKKLALERFAENFQKLSTTAQAKLTVENDDKIYTPSDLLPLCENIRIPLVYDVHHHRCNPDELSIATATKKALETWNREPLFHISSPKFGWDRKDCRAHHDFIHKQDFPNFWKKLNITLEVEAKAKELAVLQLKDDLKHLE